MAPAGSKVGSRLADAGLLGAYYLATPVFAASDALGLAPVRVAGLQGSGIRWGYYLAAFACGLICMRWPRSTPWVGMGESATNLTLLIVSFLTPIWSYADRVAAGEAVPDTVVTMADVSSFALSGAVLLFAFYRRQGLLSGRGPMGPDG